MLIFLMHFHSFKRAMERYHFLEFLTSIKRDLETILCCCEVLEKIVVSDLCCILEPYFHR